MKSYWVETTPKTNYPQIQKDENTDVCVIGGGITGITTAYLLSKSKNKKQNINEEKVKNQNQSEFDGASQKQDLSITIVEADRIAMGVTANTTAKITSQHGLIYNYLENSFGAETATAYLKSNEEALKLIENIVTDENIQCDFVKQDAYVYTCKKENDSEIRKEQQTLKAIGFNAEYVTESPLPFKIESAVKFPNQAQFHPRKYILSLLPILEKNKVKIYENSKVVDIKHKNGMYEVIVNNCKITCKYLVLASHYPIKNFPGMYFIKMYQDSSYTIGVELENEDKDIFDGMYISYDIPVTSFRNVMQENGKKLLILGGSGHKTGDTNIDIESSYTNLENYIKTIYPSAVVKYKWMTEDCVSLDKLPYIGDFSNFLPNMYVATGYKKWGMTTSHVAAKIIADKILNIENLYENIYTATRLEAIKNSKEFGNMIKQSTYSLAINKFATPKITFEELKNDSGGVVDYNGEKVGVYKDEKGKIYAVVPYCKHLGCELSWNNLEKTWDCPCHGSRYDYFGNIITEPTTEELCQKKI